MFFFFGPFLKVLSIKPNLLAFMLPFHDYLVHDLDTDFVFVLFSFCCFLLLLFCFFVCCFFFFFFFFFFFLGGGGGYSC